MTGKVHKHVDSDGSGLIWDFSNTDQSEKRRGNNGMGCLQQYRRREEETESSPKGVLHDSCLDAALGSTWRP